MSILEKNYNPSISGGAKILESETIYDYQATTGNLTLTNTSVGLIEVTSGSPTITLPTAVGNLGFDYTIKNSGVGTVTLASGGGTIDGSATQSISTLASLTVVSNGTNWIII